MSGETTLLRCPFCWGEAAISELITRCDDMKFYKVSCNDCYCIGANINMWYKSEAEAIAAWNTRVAKPCYATDYTHDHCKYSVNRGWVEDTRFFIPTAKQGGGTLTAKQVSDATYAHSIHADCADADWQAIADELNAELGGRNCARCAEDMGRYADSLCDPLKERIAELLRCLENDWHIHASWDGLRKFWCIELTEEGVRLRDAKLGSDASAVRLAERLRSLANEMRNVGASFMTTNELLACYANDVDKVADLLTFATTLGSGTCEMEYGGDITLDTAKVMGVYFCSKCGSPTYNDCMPHHCIYCGKQVKR